MKGRLISLPAVIVVTTSMFLNFPLISFIFNLFYISTQTNFQLKSSIRSLVKERLKFKGKQYFVYVSVI